MPATDAWRVALSRAESPPRRGEGGSGSGGGGGGGGGGDTGALDFSMLSSESSPRSAGSDSDSRSGSRAAVRPLPTTRLGGLPGGSDAAAAPLSASAAELRDIKQSVERLRAQRSHVEHLGHEAEQLRAQLAAQQAHTERLRAELARAQSLSQEHVELLQTVKRLEERARALEGLCGDKRAELRRAERERQQLRERLAQRERELEAHRADKRRLRAQAEELERQVAQLLATTARQTAVIDDCDRALGDAQQQRAELGELRAAVQQLEARAAGADARLARERELQSEASELRVALRAAADDKALLGERVLELQARLEAEQRDRQRWAAARLELLAEFCDEESRLTSALRRHEGREARAASASPSSPPSPKAGREPVVFG